MNTLPVKLSLFIALASNDLEQIFKVIKSYVDSS